MVFINGCDGGLNRINETGSWTQCAYAEFSDFAKERNGGRGREKDP
jgi:hypothetical protein